MMLSTEAEQGKLFQLAMWSRRLEIRGNVFYQHPRPDVVARRRVKNRVARAQRRLNRGR